MKNQSTPLPDTPAPTAPGDAGTGAAGGGGGHEQPTAPPGRLSAPLPRFVWSPLLRPSVHTIRFPFVHFSHARTRRKQSISSSTRNWQRSVNPLLLLVVIASCHAKAWTFSQSGASRSQPSHADACGCGPSVHGSSRTAVGSSRPPLKRSSSSHRETEREIA